MPPRRERTAVPGLQQLTEALTHLISTRNRGCTLAGIVVSHGAYSIDGCGPDEEREAWLKHMGDVLEVIMCLED